MSLNRRTFLGRSAALATTSLMPMAVLAADSIKLGSILDTSGPFDAYGKPMDQAMRLAVSEINEAGGLLGRQVEVTAYDTQSDMALYSQYGQQLTRQDQVDVVHGGILSASREAMCCSVAGEPTHSGVRRPAQPLFFLGNPAQRIVAGSEAVRGVLATALC